MEVNHEKGGGWGRGGRGKRDHRLTNISTGTARSPGPEEGARKVEGRRERVLEGRDWAAEPAPHELSSAKACCSEARRPASAGPPLAYPNPCSGSPFAPAGVRHGQAPPPHTLEPAAPNCATEFRGPGPGEPSCCGVWGRGAARSGAAALRRLLRRAAQTAPSPSPPGPLDPNPPASRTTPAASWPCLCCSWWF